MKYMFLVLLGLSSQAWSAETRCGWIENPTPGNYWIIDNAGLWVISTQGGEQATGDLAYPTDYANDYVATNGNYGYYCGCAQVTTSSKSNPPKVTAIHKAWVLPLQRCLDDASVLHPEYRPRKLIHSMGKAYGECQDVEEIQAGFKNRQVCINKAGDYYFLAEGAAALTN